MNASLSLRVRLLVGALLWSLGLLTILSVLLVNLIFYHPGAPQFFHTAFSRVILMSLAAALGLVAGFVVVRNGLSALDRLRERLAAVHHGEDRGVSGVYPAEVQPLVTDLNALLDHRAEAITRAVARAGDLAHALKTPLAVLAQEAERAEGEGQLDIAAAVRQQVDRMRRHVDYYLAHARAAASGATPGARCLVGESAEGLARTLRRLHAGRALTLDVLVAPEHVVRAQREDVDEMLGNLLDNACKWARSLVTIDASADAGCVAIVIDDDGGGLEPSMRQVVLRRGVRADERAPGSGLGLAIVRDLAEVYGGSITLGDSPFGGLRATLRLPAGAAARP